MLQRLLMKKSALILFIYFACSCNGASLKCFMGGTIDRYAETPLSLPEPLMHSGCIKSHLPTVFYTFGFTGKRNGKATISMLKALIESEPRNVILVDWQKEASEGLMGFAFGYAFRAIPNSQMIGKALGDAIITLTENGMKMSSVHLIGHSLGAHLMGMAGRRAKRRGYLIPRITGLDPARALFESPPLDINEMLDKTCAEFVDIIHTDPGNYGVEGSYGHLDVWPNKYMELQPGCPDAKGAVFSLADRCNHDRSWLYMAEAFRRPKSFLAISSAKISDRSNMSPTDLTFVGAHTNKKARGNYYLATNNWPPYGRGEDGISTSNNRVVRRRRREPSSTIMSLFHKSRLFMPSFLL